MDPNAGCHPDGSEGDLVDFGDGLVRRVGNYVVAFGENSNPLGALLTLLSNDDSKVFGENNTNKGLFGADIAPAAEIAATAGEAAVARYSTLEMGLFMESRSYSTVRPVIREFLGVGDDIQMDHIVGAQRGGEGGYNAYVGLYPMRSSWNRYMGMALNPMLKARTVFKSAMARFLHSGMLGSLAGGSYFGGRQLGKLIHEFRGCQ